MTKRILSLSALMLVTTAAARATAATYYVSTGSADPANPVDLSLAGSYTTTVAPGLKDVAQISTANVGTGSNYFTFDAGLSIGQLRVDLATGNAAGGTETINSANTLVLNGTTTAVGVSTGGILLNTNVGAALTVNANVQLGQSQYFTNSRTLTTFSGTIDTNGYNLYTDDASFSTVAMAFNGSVIGTGSLNVTGPGALILGASNTYSGGTNLGVSGGGGTGGTVRVANSDSALSTGTVTFVGNYALGTGSGGGARNIGNAITINSGINASLDGSNADLTLSGSITGAGNLLKTTAGNVLLTSANSYAGETNVSAGTLGVTTPGATLGGTSGLTTPVGNIVFGGVAGNGAIAFATAANLGLADQVQFSNTSGTAGTGGDLVFVGATNETVAKTILCNSSVGIRLDSNSSGGSVTYTGPFSLGSNLRPLYLGGTGIGNNTVASAFTNAGSIADPVIKTGSGKWFLSASNTYTGATNVSAGTLVVTGSTAAGSAATVSSGATLAGTGTVGGTVSVTGTITGGTGASLSTDTPGKLTTGVEAWNTGGTYLAKVTSSNGTTVTANDQLVLAGLTVPTDGTQFNLTVSATTLALQPGAVIVLADDTDATSANAFAPGNLATTLAALNLTTPGISAAAGSTLTFTDQPDATTGFDLILTATAAPEPTSLLMAAASALPLLLGRRRDARRARDA